MRTDQHKVDAEVAARMDAWRAVFERTNRIISGRPVSVQIAAEVGSQLAKVPGWTNGEQITFNGPVIRKMLSNRDRVAAVLRLKGLNYHELSHVLYTPRDHDEIVQRVTQRATNQTPRTPPGPWWYAFNALEDQRIETWFAARYGPSRRYFEAAVLEWLVREGNAEAAILTYGRKYLPARIRVQAGRVFVGKYGADLYEQFKRVIDEYIGIPLPAHAQKALRCVAEYVDLLNKMQKIGSALPDLPVPDNGCDENNVTPSVSRGRVQQSDAQEGQQAGKKATTEANEKDAKAAQDLDNDRAAAKSDEPDQGEEDGADTGDDQGQDDGESLGAGSGNDGDNEGAASEQDDESGSGDDAADDGDGPSSASGGQSPDATGTGSGGSGAGGGATKHHVMDQGELEQAVRDLVDEACDNLADVRGELAEDAHATLDAVRAAAISGRMGGGDTVDRATQATVDALMKHNLAIRKVAQILTRIRQEVEPTIERRTVSGRLDARRVLNRRPDEIDIFTRYEEGAEDATGMEAVLLLDVSGSMSWLAQSASEAVWVLKRAFEKLEIKTTVLVFDSEWQVLYRPADRAPRSSIPVINTGGGTYPYKALEHGYRVLTRSQAANKVLVTVTDGCWSGSEGDYQSLMKSMHAASVHTMLLALSGAQMYGSHGHQEIHALDKVEDLPKAVQKLVARVMRASALGV